MAERTNRFKNRYDSRNSKNATDDFVEQLYENETSEEKVEEVKSKIEESESIMPAPVNEEVKIQVAPVNAPVPVPTPKVKKKPGRPKKNDEERTSFNIKFSVSEKDMLNIASTASGKSMADYLISLIKNDYEANKAYYDAVKANIQANN